MLPASIPVPDVSDAALELAALDMLTSRHEGELPTVTPAIPKANNVAAGSDKEGDESPSRRGCCSQFFCRPFRSPARYFSRLRREFGDPLLVCLMSNYLFLKGASYHMAIAVSTPVFREVLKLQAEQHSMATALFMIPWSVKGIVGSLSDLWALGGYHKRSYMLLASLIGTTGACLLLGFANQLTMIIAVAGFFMIMVQASFNDLMCEGAYTRRMAEKPHTGAALTSFVWLCSSFGTFLQAVWVGPVVDYLPFQIVLLPFLPLCAQQLFLLLWPWPLFSWSRNSGVLGETYVEAKDRFKVALLTEHKRVFVCAICLTVCAFGSMVAGIMNDSRHIVGIVYWFCAALSMTTTVACTMPAHLAKPVIYMFLSRMLVPTISSQFSYWLRAGPECVPDGPHFNWTFLLTWNALAQSFFAFVGVALFQRYVSKWTFRRAFLVTSVLQQLTCLFDIAMVMRWNRALGIPDKVWYFCSAAIIEEVASMWAFMPGCVLISRICPKNIESTMYAVVAGLQNFAQSMSKFSGNFLCYTILGIRTLQTAETGCDFTRLPLGIGIAMGICPILPISLTFWLIPHIHMDELVALPEQQAAAAAAADLSDAAGEGENVDTLTPESSGSSPASPSDDVKVAGASSTAVAPESTSAAGRSTSTLGHSGSGSFKAGAPGVSEAISGLARGALAEQQAAPAEAKPESAEQQKKQRDDEDAGKQQKL